MEIVVSFFAALGALYLLRELLLFFIYRKNDGGFWLRVDLTVLDRAAYVRLLQTLCDVNATPQGRALIKGVELWGRGFGVSEARSLAARLGIAVRVPRKVKVRRFLRAPSEPPGI